MQAPRLWLRLVRDRSARVGLIIVIGLTLAALAAPWLAPADPVHGSLRDSLRSPSHTFWLGTDVQGRDVLTRVLFGARLSLAVGLVSQSVASLLGLVLGLLAGYYGRWLDALLMRLADITLAFPSLCSSSPSPLP
jgi:ABC-type dipeptide/oligopeptide/nickel transport system permease subunit